MSHGHSHGSGGCDGDRDHDDTPEMGLQYSLYSKIDTNNLECLNESVEGSGKFIFKPWEERLTFDKKFKQWPVLTLLGCLFVNVVYSCLFDLLMPVRINERGSFDERKGNKKLYVESDADQELLLNIPFTGNVKLKGIVVIGADDESHPAKMKLYKNRPGMTFDDTALQPDQEFDLHVDTTGTLEYSTMVVKFASVHHLTIYFPTNFGAETTRIYYIGLRGEYMTAHRHGVTICTYEARPNVADHKADAMDHVSYEIQ